MTAKRANYKGIIRFAIILLFAHFFWKFTMKGDDSDDEVIFFGIELTKPFNWSSTHVADVVYYTLGKIGYEVEREPGNVIRHTETRNAVRVVWACTGLKQAYIFAMILLFSAGPWKRKLWYIPSGLVLVYLFNLFRITYITAVVHHHPERFEYLHEHFFKYLFYGLIFMMWVLWEEKISKVKKTELAKNSVPNVELPVDEKGKTE